MEEISEDKSGPGISHERKELKVSRIKVGGRERKQHPTVRDCTVKAGRLAKHLV